MKEFFTNSILKTAFLLFFFCFCFAFSVEAQNNNVKRSDSNKVLSGQEIPTLKAKVAHTSKALSYKAPTGNAKLDKTRVHAKKKVASNSSKDIRMNQKKIKAIDRRDFKIKQLRQ